MRMVPFLAWASGCNFVYIFFDDDDIYEFNFCGYHDVII